MDTKQDVIIRGQDNTHIILDGPAIRIKMKDKSDQLIPLRRIQKICSFGSCKWETNALLACSAKNISIHFCKQDGSIKAELMPPMPDRHDMPIIELLTDQISSYEKGKEFNQWLCNQTQIAKNEAYDKIAEHYGIKQKEHKEYTIDAVAKKHINSTSWKKLKDILYALIKSDISNNLWNDNIRPSLAIFELHNINLIKYNSEIIYCKIMPKTLIKLIMNKDKNVPKDKKIVLNISKVIAIHQSQKQTIQHQYNQNLIDIHKRLLELKHGPK